MTGRMLVEHTLKGRQTRPDVDNFRLLLALYASSPTISFLAGLKVESGWRTIRCVEPFVELCTCLEERTSKIQQKYVFATKIMLYSNLRFSWCFQGRGYLRHAISLPVLTHCLTFLIIHIPNTSLIELTIKPWALINFNHEVPATLPMLEAVIITWYGLLPLIRPLPPRFG